MAFSSLSSNYSSVQIIIGITSFLTVLLLVIIIAIDVVKKVLTMLYQKQNDTSENTSIDIRLLIYSDLLLMLVHMAISGFNFLLSSNSSECQLYTKYFMLVYHLVRCVMYLIFLRRIQVIYGDTMFALSKLHIYILYTVITIYLCLTIVFTNSTQVTYNPSFGCTVESQSQLLFFIVSALDLLVLIYCLYLFIYPLALLIKKQENDDISYKLYNVIIKYSVLYITAVFSLCTFILCSYFLRFGYNYAIIDDFINGMILILLHPIHNKLYKCICCIPHKCCIYLSNAPKEASQTQQLRRRGTKVTVHKADKHLRTHHTQNISKVSPNGSDQSGTKIKQLTIKISPPTNANLKNIKHSPVTSNDIKEVNAVLEKMPSTKTIDVAQNIRDIMAKAKLMNSVKALPVPMQSTPSENTSTDVKLDGLFAGIDSTNSSKSMSWSPQSSEPMPVEMQNYDSDSEDIVYKNRNDNLAVIDAIHEEVELTHLRVFGMALQNLPSFNSVRHNTVDFEKKKSNTIQFINYESTEL